MSIVLASLIMMIDLALYLQHLMDESSRRLDEELNELRYWLASRQRNYLETFYLVPITRQAVSPSITAMLQAQYRALSVN